MAKLRPCKESLKQHIKRTNYQVAIQKQALENFQEIPKLTDGFKWILNESGDIEPLWCENNILPTEFVDLLAQPDDKA